MLETIKSGWAWLAAQHATLPYLLTTLSCLLGIDLWKKVHPRSWHWAASLTPFAEEITKAQEIAHNFLLALPQVAGAAFFTWLASGGELVPTLLGAVAGAGAPLLHHGRKLLESLRKPPPGGDQKPVGIRDHIVIPRPDGSVPPPAAAFRAWLRWSHATVLLATFALGTALSFAQLSCSPSALQAQREAANVVAQVANKTVEPALLAAYRATGKQVVDAEPNRELAQAKLNWHIERWKPVWKAWASFQAAHAAWQKQVEAGGDTLVAAAQARESFCELRRQAGLWGVELPDFPGLACPAGGS